MSYPNEIEMMDANNSHKCTTPDTAMNMQKKSKCIVTTMIVPIEKITYEFWYGFPTLEILAYEAGMLPISTRATVPELITRIQCEGSYRTQ